MKKLLLSIALIFCSAIVFSQSDTTVLPIKTCNIVVSKSSYKELIALINISDEKPSIKEQTISYLKSKVTRIRSVCILILSYGEYSTLMQMVITADLKPSHLRKKINYYQEHTQLIK